MPAFNEVDNMESVVLTLKKLNYPFDIVIVDDGSTDGTAKKAIDSGSSVVSHPTNLGYSAAIQTGFKYAEKKNYPYVIFFDGDGQHDPNSIIDMMEAITLEHVDVVIGSRFLQDGDMKIGVSKRMAIIFFQHIIYLTTKKRITDPTSGFKAYKANVYKLFTKPNEFFYDLPDSNFIIDILLRKHTILEIPVNMFDRQNGKSKIHNTGIKPFIYMAQTLLSILIVIIKKKRILKIGGKLE
nr:glycosyltransferase family 2 protein [Paenisporosarcina indica]